MTVRVGIVGVGFIGKTHADIYLKNSKAKLVAFTDTDPKRLKGDWAGGGNLGDAKDKSFDVKSIKAHNSPDDLFNDPNIDVVDLCVPTHHHVDLAVKALAAGKHVLCEKPLSVDLDQAKQAVAAAKKAKGKFMVAQCMRFWPEWSWLKEAVSSGKYGKVKSASFRRFASVPTYSLNSWILDPKNSGSALFDLHIHDTDFVRYVFGEPEAVFSAGSRGKTHPDAIDHVNTSYLYPDKNLLVCAEGGWNADTSFGFVMRYTVVFEKATADFDLGRAGKTLLLSMPGEKDAQVIPVKNATGWAEQIDYFLGCIEEGQAPKVTTPEDACRSVQLVHAEQQSVLTREVVKFKPE